MLTPRENYLRALRKEPYEYTPIASLDIGRAGGVGWLETGPPGGGLDGFGVPWVNPDSGAGAPLPEPGNFILTDVTQWKEKVTIPDVDAIDWDKVVESMPPVDREQLAIEASCRCGVFERLGALMGFEEALLAMAEEPEAVNDLFEAITTYKIKYAEKLAKYIKPDIFTNFDDIATEHNPFISYKTYNELIKPHHKRLNNACWNLGIIPLQHTCGRAEDYIEGYIETNAAAWTLVQPRNDIVSALKKYGDKICLIGGYNANGPPGFITATEEMIKDEVRRCFDTYAPYKSYIFSQGAVVFSSQQAQFREKFLQYVRAACLEFRKAEFEKLGIN